MKIFITHANENAFPVPPDAIAGLTKREYFAALALQGLLAFPEAESVDKITSLAVRMSDSLINELNK